MARLKVFVPNHRGSDELKQQQLALYKQKKIEMSPDDLSPGLADGDIVTVTSSAGGSTTLTLAAEGARKGWVALSYEAARDLCVRPGQSYDFVLTPQRRDEMSGTRPAEAGQASESLILSRLDELAELSRRADIRAEQTLSHSAAHRAETFREAKRGTQTAYLLFGAGVVLSLILWWFS